MYTVEDESYQGLFGYAEANSYSSYRDIHHIIVTESCNVVGVNNIGAIVGYARYYNIYCCTNFNNIDYEDDSEAHISIGGIVGQGSSTNIYDCLNAGYLRINYLNVSNKYVGGIVGYGSGDVYRCENSADISSYTNVGGVAGFLSSSSVYDCYNKGFVSAKTDNVGGIIGWYQGAGNVFRCINNEVVDAGRYRCGGIIGAISVDSNYNIKIFDSVNYGMVDTGGIVGDLTGEYSNSSNLRLKIINCYSSWRGIIDGGYKAGNTNNSVINCSSVNDSSSNFFSMDKNFITSWEPSWYIAESGMPELRALMGDEYAIFDGLWTENYAQSFAGGDGSEGNPYRISTPEQLARLAYLINNSSTNSNYRTKHYIQTADIDLNGHYWVPIGTSNYYFSGIYDGGGFTISGMCSPLELENGQGLFGYVRSVNKEVRLKNINISANNYKTGASVVSSVVGSQTAQAYIENCSNSASIASIYNNVGGIAGYASYSSFVGCYNEGDVFIVGSYGGGIVGSVSSVTIINSYNIGGVKGVGDGVGGISGPYAKVFNCYNLGTVKSLSGSYYGGISGGSYSSAPTIKNCFNVGKVDCSEAQYDNLFAGICYTTYDSNKSNMSNNYVGGNCSVDVNDSQLTTHAKDINWYLDSANWHEDYPWDFENVWTFVEGMNDGYPVLRGFSTKITYNSNAQPEEVVSESFSVGETIVLAEVDLFEREGYSISSWNTMADGSGDSFAPGATYTGSSVILYAQWEAMVITVNLDVNGGSGGISAIYLKYDSGWYSSSSCTSPSKITALPSTPTRTGYEFKGYSTDPDGSGTLAVSATGAINVSDTFYSTDGARTWYAVWEARNPAYYDSDGGYWYVENGKLPQSKVGDSLKKTLERQWGSLSDGSVYYMGVEELANSEFASDGGMQSKVYNGKEYVKFNGEYYLVEPIRWRLVYSSSQQEGYAVENTSVLATMAEIVFLGSYSSTKIGAGEGYSAESVTMLLKNQVSDEYLVNESREVEIFRAPKDTTTVSGSVFVASSEELANFTTSKNNTTGSGVKAGKVSFSDFVKDYLRATGQGDYYFTRDLGDQLNTIRCLNPVGDRSQAKAQQTLGVQFTVKVKEFAM